MSAYGLLLCSAFNIDPSAESGRRRPPPTCRPVKQPHDAVVAGLSPRPSSRREYVIVRAAPKGDGDTTLRLGTVAIAAEQTKVADMGAT